jgi:hypothetical protein
MHDGGAPGAGPASTTSGAIRLWPVLLPGALGIMSTVLLIVADLGGLIMGSWGPQPGLGWLKSDLAVNIALDVVTVAAVLAGLLLPGMRRTAIVTAWLVIPAGWIAFLITIHLTRNAA